jgi:ABC-type sugar transport system permease subunit
MDTWTHVWQHIAMWPDVGPSGPHDILCISLSSELQSRQMIYPFRSSRWARCNGADQFGIWGCLWWCRIYAIGLLALNYIIPCAFRCILQQKIETQTLVKIVGITPILVLMITFHLFYAGIDGLKVVLNSRQQLPHTWPLLVPSKGRTNQVDMVSRGMKRA